MSFWAKDPELFLHKSRDGVVHLRRCKKDTTSTSSMLMRPEDLKDEGVVTDHLSLYGGFYDWEINKYQALIDYIHPKRLMVNCRGSLIVELATDDKAAPVVYIRALDILAMGSYGPPDLTVPARTVRYLQNGKAVPTDSNPQETKDEAKLKEKLAQKTKEAAALQVNLTDVQNKNKILTERVKELEKANENCSTTLTTYRVYTKADTGYSLTIRDGQVILAKCDKYDVYQYWIRDNKYGATVKDAHGSPSFALVNEFTGQAMKHPAAARKPVQLVPYNPSVVDESILWTEKDIGDGYNTIRMVNNTDLILDAFNGDQAHGGVRDGTIIKVWEFSRGENQHWNIVPCSKPIFN